jgi:hypothetical protein
VKANAREDCFVDPDRQISQSRSSIDRTVASDANGCSGMNCRDAQFEMLGD